MDTHDSSLNAIETADSTEAFVPITAPSNEHLAEGIGSDFSPTAPKSLEDAGLHPNDLYPLVLKYLFLHGNRAGSRIASQLKLPFHVVEPILQALKTDMLIGHKSNAGMSDYSYEITPKGVEQAKIHLARTSYCGAAPVSIEAYNDSVKAQSLKNLKPTYDDVKRALSDLTLSDLMICQLGQAINSGKGMFLFGAPGNGKTSIAERAIASVHEFIWIPRALTVSGEVIRLYDSMQHEAAPLAETSLITISDVDERWIRIKRPTIVVGGELEMKHLEATLNPITGIIEAPVHVKSNCGCMVVDDFGRQQISTTELLNRWIVPMESGHDFMNLPSGRQVSLPFEQLLIFSTNLDPNELCDEAFLRRIPYKIEVFDPTEEQFKHLFQKTLYEMKFHVEEGVVDHLVEYHYKRPGRPFRFCHVGDLLGQAKDFCDFHRRDLLLDRNIVELAVLNYFSGMEAGRN
jgi:predicted ATPase with chaperone activity